MAHDPQSSGLAIGMFLGGLLMALVPIALTVGLGIWALRERVRPGSTVERDERTTEEIL